MKVITLETNRLAAQELEELQWAHRRLEHPSLAARISNVIGLPIEESINLLPKEWSEKLHKAVERSIHKSLEIAIGTMDRVKPKVTGDYFHKVMAAGSGAVGGFLGPLALLAELPIMTILILRSIAEIARNEGEDLALLDTRRACVEVFALGGRSKDDDATEAGYYGVRTVLGLHFSTSLVNTAEGKALVIPSSIEFIRAVAARFGLVIEDKIAAKMIPVAGAISGAALNLIFMNHYQDVARGHFIVRRLEKKYGSETIKNLYQKLTAKEIDSNKSFSPIEGW
jgi:hypothetical protein